MKKSVIALIIGVVIVAVGAGGYVLLNNNKSSNDSASESTNQPQSSNTESSNQAIKEEELEGKLVDSFPKDQVPLYDGEVTSSLGRMSEYLKKPEWNVDIVTKDSFADVNKSIRSAYESNGWSITSDSKHPLGGTMLTTKNDNFIVTVTYNDAGADGIEINYGVSAK